MNKDDVTQLNLRFADASTAELLEALPELFQDKVVATSSFQTQSIPLLHLMSRHCPDVKIYFLDTGFHFKETLYFVEDLRSRFGLKIESLSPLLGHEKFREEYGELHQEDPSMCCYLNKVEPMKRALQGAQAWISGIRRDQTKTRAMMQRFNFQAEGVLKVCPMIGWDQEQVDAYIKEYSLPKHPLLGKGYRSIGCAPCSKPTEEGQDAREGRWAGSEKTECGLHSRYKGFGSSTSEKK